MELSCSNHIFWGSWEWIDGSGRWSLNIWTAREIRTGWWSCHDSFPPLPSPWLSPPCSQQRLSKVFQSKVIRDRLIRKPLAIYGFDAQVLGGTAQTTRRNTWSMPTQLCRVGGQEPVFSESFLTHTGTTQTIHAPHGISSHFPHFGSLFSHHNLKFSTSFQLCSISATILLFCGSLSSTTSETPSPHDSLFFVYCFPLGIS